MTREDALEEVAEEVTVRSRFRRLVGLASVDFTPLRRHRDFRLLYIGQTVTFCGSAITMVAIPFQLYQLTRSSLLVGLLGLFEIVPILALAFLGGALADAADRRRMVQLTELALAVVSGALLGNALLPHPQVWVLFLAASVLAGLDALQRPSLSALLPRLVDRDEILAASALSSLKTTAGMIVAPALAGVMIAAFGIGTTYGVDVLTFLVSLLCLALMRAVPPPPDAERPSVRRIVEGLRYARSRPELMGTYLVDMIAMFFGMPEALFPAIATRFGGAQALGLLFAAPAVGSFIFAGTSGWSKNVHRHGRAIVLAATGWGLATIGFGFSSSLPLALVFLALAGGSDMISGLFRSAIWNQTIPDELRGRLASIELVSFSSGPTLGNVEAGTVATLFGVRASVVSGGVLCVVGTIAMAFALPLFWTYDARQFRPVPTQEAVQPDPVGTL